MSDFSKSERKRLRALAGLVYETEARTVLSERHASFEKWHLRQIDSSELLQEIHEFHQHQSRELWALYQSMKEDQIVARGLAEGFIEEKQVESSLLSKLQAIVQVYRE